MRASSRPPAGRYYSSTQFPPVTERGSSTPRGVTRPPYNPYQTSSSAYGSSTATYSSADSYRSRELRPPPTTMTSTTTLDYTSSVGSRTTLLSPQIGVSSSRTYLDRGYHYDFTTATSYRRDSAAAATPAPTTRYQLPSTTDTQYSYSNNYSNNRGEVGLDNLGNTCFMNAAIQCLVRVPAFGEYILQHGDSLDINTGTKSRGRVTLSLVDLTKRLLLLDTRSVPMYDFRQAITRFAQRFDDYQQHDSHEFLRFVLDGLHEELNRIRTPPPYQELKDIDGESARDQAARWIRYHDERNNSIITELFGGTLQSERKCSVCGYVSRSFDPFLDLSVPVKKSSSGRTSLQDCLAQYTTPELLSGSERAYCSRCKKHTDSTIQLTVYRLPRILVVQLKRFSGGSGQSMLRGKVTDTVDCPVQMPLEMKAYMSPDSPYRQLRHTEYVLTGVVNHSGYSGGGHYTATAKSSMRSSTWCEYDDGTVRPTSRISGSQAYVLFFERKDDYNTTAVPSRY
eukprot:PhM_4_TR364/c0_g1_i3/m.16319/K11833/USP2; ubiquitin carboxyl-terminal hydrolase 2